MCVGVCGGGVCVGGGGGERYEREGERKMERKNYMMTVIINTI